MVAFFFSILCPSEYCGEAAMGQEVVLVGNPDLGGCQLFTAADNGLDITTCGQCLLHVAFSLGKSPMGDYWVCTNPVGSLGVTCI